jgi:ATP-binding cassette subfamily F protein 3
MSILSVHNLSKYFGGQDIFDSLSLTISHGARIALVGPNGEGKTTLLRILAGLETPTAGAVTTAKGLSIGYLEQHPSLISNHSTLWELALAAFAGLRAQETQLHELEYTLTGSLDESRRAELLQQYGELQTRFEHAGGYSYEQTIREVLAGLGFDPADYQTPLARFSGGQQSRAHLARLLLEKPNLLLLDEPTNHLDLASVEWLENYLPGWPGAMVIVAHDRYFLDRVANRIWEMAFGQVEIFRGNFSHYVAQRAERFERRLKEYETQREFIAREEDFIRRNLAGQRTKEAQGRRKRLERLGKMARPQENKTLNLSIQPVVRSGDLVLATHDLVVGYPDGPPLFRSPNLEIRRGHRVALLGPNGSGKTTFLKTILGQVPPKAGAIRLGAGVEIGYFAQTQASLNLEATILDEILAMENMPIGEARNYLGRFLFSGDDVFKPIGSLSGGERSRVALAKLVLTGANFFVLDEPTNHLDIASQESLEEVLGHFGGTILLVSHDRYFVDALATHVWALEPDTQTVTALEGGYSHYLAQREAQKQQLAAANGHNQNGSRSTSQVERNLSKAEKRAVEKKVRQLADLETQIESAESRLAQLARDLEEAGRLQALDDLQKLGQAYQDTEARLEQLFVEWTELEAA